jgi:hypothetical protein
MINILRLTATVWTAQEKSNSEPAPNASWVELGKIKMRRNMAKSFKLRWPVRNHVMFDGCLIVDHSHLVLSPHLSPHSLSLPPLLTLLLAPGPYHSPLSCSVSCFVIPGSCISMRRHACLKSGLLRQFRVTTRWTLSPPSSNPQASQDPSSPKAFRVGFKSSFNCKNHSSSSLQAATVFYPILSARATQCYTSCSPSPSKPSSSQSPVLWCPNDVDCGPKCVSANAAIPFSRWPVLLFCV